ncbi:MAG: hypothetical protein HC836_45315 [Richelia sp. RM2_1_2]|nr:hypothetical protein [Richelia sp. RM2_1_2]
MNYIVYKVTSPSNKVYIGITKYSLANRRAKHIWSAKNNKKKIKFNKAILKYKDLLKWEVIKQGLSQTLAKKYEIYYIKFYNSYKKGYNATLGGDSITWVNSPKMTRHQAGKNGQLKQSQNPNHKLNLSKALKSYFSNNLPARKNISLKTKARLLNPENNKKHREALKKVFSLPEQRLANSKRQGGKPFNVYCYVSKKYIGTWEIQADCNTSLGICNGKIAACLKGSRTHTKNYIFKYTEDPTVVEKEYNQLWNLKIKRSPNKNSKN